MTSLLVFGVIFGLATGHSGHSTEEPAIIGMLKDQERTLEG